MHVYHENKNYKCHKNIKKSANSWLHSYGFLIECDNFQVAYRSHYLYKLQYTENI